MIQPLAHPRTSRVIRSSEMSVYRRTSTYRRARARENRKVILALVLAVLAVSAFLGVGYAAAKSANPNASTYQLLWGEGCHE